MWSFILTFPLPEDELYNVLLKLIQWFWSWFLKIFSVFILLAIIFLQKGCDTTYKPNRFLLCTELGWNLSDQLFQAKFLNVAMVFILFRYELLFKKIINVDNFMNENHLVDFVQKRRVVVSAQAKQSTVLFDEFRFHFPWIVKHLVNSVNTFHMQFIVWSAAVSI